REVMAYSRNVTVLRAGRNAGDFATAETSPEELLAHMIGPRAARTAGAAELATVLGSPAESAGCGGPLDGSDPSDRTDGHRGDDALTATTRPILEITNLTVRSRRGRPAVDGASL